MLSLLMPPVGINFTCGKGAESAFNAFNPPYTFAGKNLRTVNPKEIAFMISVGVTQPMELMMLGIRSGEHIVVRVEGPDEATAAEAIRKIMATF